MANSVAMRPQLVSIIAGVSHDQSTPSAWTPSQTPNHPAKTVTFDTPGFQSFRVPYWVRSIRRQLWGGGGGGGGFTLGGGNVGRTGFRLLCL